MYVADRGWEVKVLLLQKYSGFKSTYAYKKYVAWDESWYVL